MQIRKPLKEKTLQINISEPGIKREVKEEKETDIRNNSRILNISHLQIKEIENMDTSDDKDKVFDKGMNIFCLFLRLLMIFSIGIKYY